MYIRVCHVDFHTCTYNLYVHRKIDRWYRSSEVQRNVNYKCDVFVESCNEVLALGISDRIEGMKIPSNM